MLKLRERLIEKRIEFFVWKAEAGKDVSLLS